MSVENELKILLETNPNLSAINADRVYYQEGPQKDQPTYVVFNTSDEPIRSKDGIAGWDKYALIVCYAKLNSNAIAMQNAIVVALEEYSSNSIYEIEVKELNQSKNQEQNIYEREITALIEI